MANADITSKLLQMSGPALKICFCTPWENTCHAQCLMSHVFCAEPQPYHMTSMGQLSLQHSCKLASTRIFIGASLNTVHLWSAGLLSGLAAIYLQMLMKGSCFLLVEICILHALLQALLLPMQGIGMLSLCFLRLTSSDDCKYSACYSQRIMSDNRLLRDHA